MVALVSAVLRVLKIIFDPHHGKIVLLSDHVRHPVDIGGEGAYDADPRNIIHIIDHIIYGAFVSVAPQLLYNALRRLDP